MNSKRLELLAGIATVNAVIADTEDDIKRLKEVIAHAEACPNCITRLDYFKQSLSGALKILIRAIKTRRKFLREYENVTYFRPIKRTSGFGRQKKGDMSYGLN